mgnify:CR=1 FL=1
MHHFLELARVITVLPEIVPQAVLFTFDMTRIKKDPSNLDKIGSYWLLNKNADQTISSIEKGDLNAD